MRVCRAGLKNVAGYYQYREHLGSSVIEANELGQVISYEEYYPYGRSAYRAAASGVDLSLKRYRFTGKERDEETGLDYFGVRYYASWLGRWTSGDPGGFVDGLNLYRYVRNNPVNGIDNLGYQTEPPPDDCPNCPPPIYSWSGGSPSTSLGNENGISSTNITIPSTQSYGVDNGAQMLPLVTVEPGIDWQFWGAVGLAAATIAISFTPLGAAMDVFDLARAVLTGDPVGTVEALLGFIPGLDAIKFSRKFDEAADLVESGNKIIGGGLEDAMKHADELENFGVRKPDFKPDKHVEATRREVGKAGEKISADRAKPVKDVKGDTGAKLVPEPKKLPDGSDNPNAGKMMGRTSGGKTSNKAYTKNAGYLEGKLEVGGVDIIPPKKVEYSGSQKLNNEYFQAKPGYEGHTEYNILNNIADAVIKRAGKPVNGQYPNVTGTIKVVSELPYCISCRDIIMKQWHSYFPNTTLVLVDGVRNRNKLK